MTLPRRQFLRLVGIDAVLPCASRIAYAQTYPTRQITLAVPIAPGGAVDGASDFFNSIGQNPPRAPQKKMMDGASLSPSRDRRALSNG